MAELEPSPTSPPNDSDASTKAKDDAGHEAQVHSKYFFDDVPVIFEVEGVLFKVHTHFLTKHSPVFDTMFSCPPGEDGPEGQSVDRPIPLPGVTVKEWEALLDFFYEGERKGIQDGGEEGSDRATISTRFDFEMVRRLAMDALELRVPDPIERILIARKYELDEWLYSAYLQLCLREAALNEDEGNQLGMRTTVLLAKSRELLAPKRSKHGFSADRHKIAGEIVTRVCFPVTEEVQDNTPSA
ncbi:hypothetical protein DFP72DRAFT_1012155 [Ephemerocybe angulata]|uniref:BTB domain-containing protein n=1 Tax=Ephemerocybe angulata TaxID=980116 RepID=A0A8H6M4Y7_9AGAR|nr:hypothetical protein DFP72DRAFT_1012155 [Tulosesus angulatus]